MTEPTINQSFRDLFSLLWSKRITIIIIGFVAAIISAGVSFLLPEYFVSSVTIFPSRINSIVLTEGIIRGNVSDFGEEEEAEQTLQIIESEQLIDKVVARTDLYKHYQIEPDGAYARTKMYQTYHGNVEAKRTKYNSISIRVKDKDPKKAADIANAINAAIDEVKNALIKSRAKSFLESSTLEIARVQVEVDSIISALSRLEARGVVSENERAALLRSYGQAVNSNNQQVVKSLAAKIELNKQYGTAFDMLKRRRDQRSDHLERLNRQKEQFAMDANLSVSQKFVVDNARPADKKSYPVRWLVVMIGSALAGVGTVLYLIFQHYRRQYLKEA